MLTSWRSPVHITEGHLLPSAIGALAFCRQVGVPEKERKDKDKTANKIKAALRAGTIPKISDGEERIRQILGLIEDIQKKLQDRPTIKDVFQADREREAVNLILAYKRMQEDLEDLWEKIYGKNFYSHFVLLMMYEPHLFNRYQSLLKPKDRKRIEQGGF